MYQIRTDLALETQEKMQEDHVELKGVRFLEEKLSPNLTVSTVVTGQRQWENPREHTSPSRRQIWMRRTRTTTERYPNSLRG